MHNIFLVYMPPGNPEAMIHYRDTIQQKVPLERVVRFLPRDAAERLRRVFGSRPIAVWGSRDSSANRAKFEKMKEGDDLLIVEGETIKLMGKIALKTVSADLSRKLWHNILDPSHSAGWDLVYFIANPLEVGVPFEEFCRLFDYKLNYRLQGFTAVSSDKLENFYDKYDDLYSILARIRDGQKVMAKPHIDNDVSEVHAPLEQNEPDDAQPIPAVSDHIRMQCKLANLGRKAGEKIWVPSGDQRRLREICGFDDFEPEFSAGIDLPRNYFENIDVVWKEEFRIDAAFEVENSTAIYSGLLRFADLNIVAPNTTYPMFIVAPSERRNRVREQLLRPVFRRLELRHKVRFLSYEDVDEIDRFFEGASAGLSVDLIKGRSQRLVDAP